MATVETAETCEECQTPLHDGSRFCMNCGAPVSTGADGTSTEGLTEPPAESRVPTTVTPSVLKAVLDAELSRYANRGWHVIGRPQQTKARIHKGGQVRALSVAPDGKVTDELAEGQAGASSGSTLPHGLVVKDRPFPLLGIAGLVKPLIGALVLAVVVGVGSWTAASHVTTANDVTYYYKLGKLCQLAQQVQSPMSQADIDAIRPDCILVGIDIP